MLIASLFRMIRLQNSIIYIALHSISAIFSESIL